MDQHVGKISCFDVVVSQEKGGCMPTHDSPRTPKPSTESHVPRRPPEVDQFVDRFLTTVCDTSRRYILEMLVPPGRAVCSGSEDGVLPQLMVGRRHSR